MDVRGPFEFGRVSVPRANVPSLELLKLLLRTEFVCLFAHDG